LEECRIVSLKLLVMVTWGSFPESVLLIIEEEYDRFLVMMLPRNLI